MGQLLRNEPWDYPRQKLLVTPEIATLFEGNDDTFYTKLLEDALMAVTFGYRDELFQRLLNCTVWVDHPYLLELYNTFPLNIRISRGNLIISA